MCIHAYILNNKGFMETFVLFLFHMHVVNIVAL